MTALAIAVATALACGLLLAVAAAVDRSARATAWRRIAEARRWNHDNHMDAP